MIYRLCFTYDGSDYFVEYDFKVLQWLSRSPLISRWAILDPEWNVVYETEGKERENLLDKGLFKKATRRARLEISEFASECFGFMENHGIGLDALNEEIIIQGYLRKRTLKGAATVLKWTERRFHYQFHKILGDHNDMDG